MSKSKNQKLILGVDAGNTKTQVVFANQDLQPLKIIKGEAGGIHDQNIIQSIKNINQTIRHGLKLLKKKKSDIIALHLGVAGIDDQKTLNKVFNTLKKEYPQQKLSISNDILIALKSGTDSLPTVTIIAGTGVNCLGINKKGEIAKTSGLGHILADEGGGYWIGLHLLKFATRSYDGRFKKTKILNIIKQHFKLKNFEELQQKIYNLKDQKKEIASLANYLTDELIKSDRLAKNIANHAAEQLALNVNTVAKKLKLSRQPFNLVIVGGILTNKKYILSKFKKLVKEQNPMVKIIIPPCPPVIGALKIAKENLNNQE